MKSTLNIFSYVDLWGIHLQIPIYVSNPFPFSNKARILQTFINYTRVPYKLRLLSITALISLAIVIHADEYCGCYDVDHKIISSVTY